MKDDEKKKTCLGNKTKGEQFFLLLLVFIAFVGVFCITGCGGCLGCLTCGMCDGCSINKCEKPDFGLEGSSVGCSIPGCGGCFTPQKGCSTALWPQSIKLTCSKDEYSEDRGNTKTEEKYCGMSCDDRYYGKGCLGCGQVQNSCFSGCISLSEKTTRADETEENSMKIIVIGDTDGKEFYLGCWDGHSCIGCIEPEAFDMIREWEEELGVD